MNVRPSASFLASAEMMVAFATSIILKISIASILAVLNTDDLSFIESLSIELLYPIFFSTPFLIIPHSEKLRNISGLFLL